MSTENSEEREFLERANKKLLGERYDAFLQDQLAKQRRAAIAPSSGGKRWLYIISGLAASLILVIWCAYSLQSAEKLPETSGLLSVLAKANHPISTGSGSIFDPSRGKDNLEQRNLLQSAQEHYETGQYENAITFFQALIREDKDQPYYQLYLASAHSQLGQHDVAIADLQALLEQGHDPDLTYQATYHLGLNQILSGQFEAAKTTLTPLQGRGWEKDNIDQLLALL